MDVTAKLQQQHFSGQVTRLYGGSLQFENVQVRLPASVLATHVPVPLSGELSADIERLVVDDRQLVDVAGRMVLHNAVVLTPDKQMMLGSFAAKLSRGEHDFRAELFDLDGPTLLQGELSLAPDGNYRMTGLIALADSADESLAAILPVLGTSEADGKIRLRHNGSFW
jgi:hypothetical protein